MRRAAVPVLTVLGVLTAASAAFAGFFDPAPGDHAIGSVGGFRYVKDPEPFDPSNDNYAGPAAFCGARHVTGGGASLGGPVASKFVESSLSRDVEPIAGGDGDPVADDAWDASGYGKPGRRITTFAICTDAFDLTYPGASQPAGTSGARSATVACPTGHALGGGGLIAPVESWLGSSYPVDGADADERPDDGWRLTAHDTAGGPGGFVIEAACGETSAVAYRQARDRKVRRHRSGAATAHCRGGSHVAGGGLRVSGPVARARLIGSHPVDDGDAGKEPDDGWRASFYNLSGKRKDLTAFAVCVG